MNLQGGGLAANIGSDGLGSEIKLHHPHGLVTELGRDVRRAAITGTLHGHLDGVVIAYARVGHHKLSARLHPERFQVCGVWTGHVRAQQRRCRQIAQVSTDQHLGDL